MNYYFWSSIVLLIFSCSLRLNAVLPESSVKPRLIQHKQEIDIYEARDLYIVEVLDPMISLNKIISNFNAETYRFIEKPASFYKDSPYMIPLRWPLNITSNVISNIGELSIGTTSNLLTGDFKGAGFSLARSLINLLALGGMIDLATTLSEAPITDANVVENMDPLEIVHNSMRANIKSLRQPEIQSFDDVFKSWGFGCGVYLVFPLVGPGTGRELLGKVAEIPLQPDTYIQPIILLRIASSVHNGLSDAVRAKAFLQDFNLASPEGKAQYYNLLRTAILSRSQCIRDTEVIDSAKKQGYSVTDENE